RDALPILPEDDLEDLAVVAREAEEGAVGGLDLLERPPGLLARGIDRRLEPAHGLLDEGVEEGLLVGEVQVEGADADVGRGRDVRDLRLVEALLGEDAGRRGEEVLARARAPALEAVRSRDGRV